MCTQWHSILIIAHCACGSACASTYSFLPGTLCHFYPSFCSVLRMAVRTVRIASWKGIYCNVSRYIKSIALLKWIVAENMQIAV